MGRALLFAALVSGTTGCLSAETSEASQLSRLERGIDQSTTTVDRFTAGELAGTSPTPAPSATAIRPERAEATSERPSPSEGAADDEAPRPTIRIYGSGGRSAPVTKIEYAESPGAAPAPEAPSR